MHADAWLLWGLSMFQLLPFLIVAMFGVYLRLMREAAGVYPVGSVAKHRIWGWVAIGLMLVVVCVIEAMRCILKLPRTPFLFHVHIPILTASIVALAGSLVFNGKAWRHIHRFLAWSFLVLLVATVATGDYLVYTQIYRHR